MSRPSKDFQRLKTLLNIVLRFIRQFLKMLLGCSSFKETLDIRWKKVGFINKQEKMNNRLKKTEKKRIIGVHLVSLKSDRQMKNWTTFQAKLPEWFFLYS